MPRPPDVIAPAHIITGAATIIGSIANLDSDGAWVGAIARVTSVTGSVWAITPIIRSVPRIPSVMLIFASDYTERNRKQNKEEEHWPFPCRFRSISGGGRLLLRAINNLHLHTIIYGLDRAFTCTDSMRSGSCGFNQPVPGASTIPRNGGFLLQGFRLWCFKGCGERKCFDHGKRRPP